MPTAPVICPVCLSALLPEDNLGNPGCGHVFHKACIEEWFRVQNNRKCPHCRNSAKSAKINPIYLQFDEHPSFLASPSPHVTSANANSKTSNDEAQVQKEMDKLKSEYNNYRSKMEREKMEREQSFEFLKVQMTSLEAEVESKTRQYSIIATRLQSSKESLEQMKADVQRKKYKIEDMEKEMKSMNKRYERDVEHPCTIRTLLQAKSSEIRKRVQDYTQMGEHGMQILIEFVVAANEESKGLRNQLRELKIEYDLMKGASSSLSFLASDSAKMRSTSSSILKRTTYTNSDDAKTSQSSSSSNDIFFSLPTDDESDTTSSKNTNDIDNHINSALEKGISLSDTLSLESIQSESRKECTSDLSKPKKKAFVPINEGDDDILMEQTMIESPQSKNALTKVRGSFLSRNSLGKSSKRSLSIMRQYNGLGSSSSKSFQSQPKLKF